MPSNSQLFISKTGCRFLRLRKNIGRYRMIAKRELMELKLKKPAQI
jgi:hypothetical protein